jgi:hypothetical protein
VHRDIEPGVVVRTLTDEPVAENLRRLESRRLEEGDVVVGDVMHLRQMVAIAADRAHAAYSLQVRVKAEMHVVGRIVLGLERVVERPRDRHRFPVAGSRHEGHERLLMVLSNPDTVGIVPPAKPRHGASWCRFPSGARCQGSRDANAHDAIHITPLLNSDSDHITSSV